VSSQTRRGAPATLAACVAALPLALITLSLIVGGGPRTESDDVALLTIGARDALHGGLLLGPYSRFGWHHPGPSYFYILALPTWLWRGPTGTWIAAAALATACAAAVVILAWNGAGPVAGWIAAASVLLVVTGLGPAIVRNPWNPYAVALPALVSVLASALFAAGLRGALAWSAVAGSVAVQTHVSTAPVVVGLFGAAVLARGVVWAARRWRRDRTPPARGPAAGPALPGSRRRHRPDLVIAGVLLAAMWAPPLWDEAFGTGNLSSLLRFFTQPHPGHSWSEAWRLVSAVAGITLFQHHAAVGEGVADPHPALTTAVFVGVAVAAVVAGAWRGRPVAIWLGLFALAAGGLALESVTRVVGPAFHYLVVWMAVLPVLPVVGLAAAFGARAVAGPAPSPRPAGAHAPPDRPLVGTLTTAAAVVGVVGLATALALRAVVETPPAVASTDHDIATAYRLVAPAVGPGHATVRIEITDANRWPAAAGVALELIRHGHPVSVQPPWTLLFGTRRRATGSEPVAIVVGGLAPATWPPPAQARRLGRAGPEILFVRPAAPPPATG
jgi:hypothetical protein